MIERVELETGERLPPSVNQKILEGSFSTKLTIRCDGTRVRVEGNPSRWQRIDNLFGLQTLDECVAVYNHVLATYDLPPFTKNTRFSHRQSADGKPSRTIYEQDAYVFLEGRFPTLTKVQLDEGQEPYEAGLYTFHSSSYVVNNFNSVELKKYGKIIVPLEVEL